MAVQELAFVTATQRVLDEPLNTRFHYGHPDLFDKVSFMSPPYTHPARRTTSRTQPRSHSHHTHPTPHTQRRPLRQGVGHDSWGHEQS